MFFRKRKKKKEEKAPEITVSPYNYSFEKDALNLARFIINKSYENGLYVREMKWHSPFNEKEEKAITYIIEKFKDYSHYNLIDMVHKQKPWLDAYESVRDNVITNESIYEYFYTAK